MENQSFLKNHADTLAIIAVNLGVAGILIAICLSNISSIASVNARMDSMQVLMYQEMKDFHARMCAIEERRS